jgi:hypothetical protein
MASFNRALYTPPAMRLPIATGILASSTYLLHIAPGFPPPIVTTSPTDPSPPGAAPGNSATVNRPATRAPPAFRC